MKTLETIFIDQYDTMSAEIRALKQENEKLKKELEKPAQEDEAVTPIVRVTNISTETVSFSLPYIDLDNFKMPIKKIEEKISTDEGLRELAKKDRSNWDDDSFLCMTYHTFDHKIITAKDVFLFDIDRHRTSEVFNAHLFHNDTSEIIENAKYPAERDNEVYAEGLKIFKAEVLEAIENYRKNHKDDK